MDMEHKLELLRCEQMGFDAGFDEGSFTALLELPPPQAVELLVKEDYYPVLPPIFPSDVSLVDGASKFSVFAPPNSSNINDGVKSIYDAAISAGNSMRADVVKHEPEDSDSNRSLKSGKRKEREKKVKESSKTNKKVAADGTSEEGGDKLPYVHVRARRGQATDSHSLAERVRRDKINARMKFLQELVPGCNKISGTALVLDEIINHVQALQRRVEFLSMGLATVNPRINFTIDALLATNCGATTDNSYQGMFTPPPLLPDQQINVTMQQQEQQYQHVLNFDGLHHQPTWVGKEDDSNFVTPETSLLSHGSPSTSAAQPLCIQIN